VRNGSEASKSICLANGRALGRPPLDEVLERIYIGRRFRNGTERLEKLFELYTKMTTKVSA